MPPSRPDGGRRVDDHLAGHVVSYSHPSPDLAAADEDVRAECVAQVMVPILHSGILYFSLSLSVSNDS
jgi:hypothetical protein